MIIFHYEKIQVTLFCDECNFQSADKDGLEKRKNNTHEKEISSPAKKITKVTEDPTKAIVDELIDQDHNKTETSPDTDEDFFVVEQISFEEARLYEQFMDDRKHR